MKTLEFFSQVLSKTNRYSPSFSLPDYLYTEDGVFDREKTLQVMLAEEYGNICDQDITKSVTVEWKKDTLYAGKCKSAVLYRFELQKDGKKASFPVHVLQSSLDKNTPFVVALNFGMSVERSYLPVEEMLERGISIAHILYTDVTSDDNDFTNGIAALFGDRSAPDAPGKLSMWAYAARLAAHFLVQEELAVSDKLYVSGHSRLGKTALLAAAQDEIFAGVCINNSGSCGAAIAREKQGETVEIITSVFPYWFCPSFRRYADRENEMPFDQHYLLACVAPRKACIITAELDDWADTYAQYLCAEAASVIYREKGVDGLVCDHLLQTGEESRAGNIALKRLHGTHFMGRDNWHFFADFIFDE